MLKGGSLMRVTSRPLMRPKPAVTAMPARIASGAGSPMSAASLVITMLPSAMIMPHERSMPAVRMIRVWPIAITPTTVTCCRISEKFSPLKNWSVVKPKATQAISRAMNGPSCPIGGSLAPRVVEGMAAMVVRVRCAAAPRLLLAPAELGAHLGVLALDPVHRLGGDQRDAGVGVAADLLARGGVVDAGGH